MKTPSILKKLKHPQATRPLSGAKSRITIAWTTTISLLACGESPRYEPQTKSQRLSSRDIAIYTGSPCSKGGKQYEVQPQSKVSWQINRTMLATGASAPFTGTNQMQGGLGIMDGKLSQGKALINFLIDSTDSGDPLRNDRIISYLFRRSNRDVLRFEMDGFKEENLEIRKGGTVKGTAKGMFTLDMYTTAVEIPVAIREADGILSVSTEAPVKLNIKSLSPNINGFDLSEPLTQLISLVDGIEIDDEIDLSLTMALEDTCKD